MILINLLPWREELRKERVRNFQTTAGLAALGSVGLVVIVHLIYGGWIDYQNRRNTYLQDQIALLDKKITEIQNLEKERENLQNRMETIEKLQSSRPLVVHMFDEIVSTLPAGVYLTEIAQKGGALTVKGVAESNARVSNFMRAIEQQSPWLENPHLDIIEVKTQDGHRLSHFTMQVQQKLDDKAEETP
jgi:type IV pilus assembly protein PilN